MLLETLYSDYTLQFHTILLLYTLTGPITLIILFLVSHFIFFVYSVWYRLSWLPASFLLHVKYTLSYRIVTSYYTFCVAKHGILSLEYTEKLTAFG